MQLSRERNNSAITAMQTDPLRRTEDAPTFSDIIRKLERKIKKHRNAKQSRLSSNATVAAEAVSDATRPNYRKRDTHAGHAREAARVAAASGARPLEKTASDAWGGLDSKESRDTQGSMPPIFSIPTPKIRPRKCALLYLSRSAICGFQQRF